MNVIVLPEQKGLLINGAQPRVLDLLAGLQDRMETSYRSKIGGPGVVMLPLLW